MQCTNRNILPNNISRQLYLSNILTPPKGIEYKNTKISTRKNVALRPTTMMNYNVDMLTKKQSNIARKHLKQLQKPLFSNIPYLYGAIDIRLVDLCNIC